MSGPNTRAHKQLDGELEGLDRRRFMRVLLAELHALERMLAEGRFERGVTRIGAEQELFLVDRGYQASSAALEVLERLKPDPHYTTELGRFQLEMNADPQPLSGQGLWRMEQQLTQLYDKVRAAAAEVGVHTVLAGILPTLTKSDLGLHNMVPSQRYMTLNKAMNAARGEAFDFSLRGIDELSVKHDSVMVEACNASYQAHLQLAEPERFPQFYNLAQLLAGPVLAASTNSPLLFGRRLWAETRIALFEQSCDIRTPGLHLRDQVGRVSFGRQWLKGSVADLYKENIAKFRALVGTEIEEDADKVLDEGGVPDMKALRLHNGTIYRWNRACYGVSENGKPHLRIELRVLPSGPTIADEVASTALWLGLMVELGSHVEDVSQRIPFDHARANLYNAARDGLSARFTWLDGEELIAQTLVLDKLLPLAEAGLGRAGVTPTDVSRYLGILDKRVRSLATGSRWMLRSFQAMGNVPSGARSNALVAAMIARQKDGKPVAEWPLARVDENEATSAYHKVSQFMTTDLFTVRPDDPVELVAEVSGWERLRHIPVEDEKGRLVGLISARAVARHLESRKGMPPGDSIPVADLMKTQLITVTPDTPTADAIELGRKHQIGVLPVVQDSHLVGILTPEDLSIVSEGQHGQPGPNGLTSSNADLKA